MSDKLARRYELLLRAYPQPHRQQWGDELLGTLLMRADSARHWPPAGEAVALLAAGMRIRLNSDKDRTPRATWAMGLRVAVVLLLASELGELIVQSVWWGTSAGRTGFAMLSFGVLAFLAVLRDRRWVALLATLGWEAMYARGFFTVSWPMVAAILLLVAVALLRHTQRDALPGRWWLAVPAMMAIFWGPQMLLPELVYPLYYKQAMMLTVVALCAAATLLDSRAAFAAVGLLLAQVFGETMFITWTNPAHEISYHVAASPWSAVAGAAAAALLIGGHLVTQRRASL